MDKVVWRVWIGQVQFFVKDTTARKIVQIVQEITCTPIRTTVWDILKNRGELIDTTAKILKSRVGGYNPTGEFDGTIWINFDDCVVTITNANDMGCTEVWL